MFLYGASGHGKVIKEILESQDRCVDGFIDDNHEINEKLGLPVKHSMDGADEVIVSIGINQTRKKVVDKLNCKFAEAAIHSAAVVSHSAQIAEGTVIMAGVVINAETRIGKHCIVNTGASIDHECVIEDFVHISPHATLCGNVCIGEGTLIGAGSVVIPGIKIGKWCTIGAGSFVIKDISDCCIAYGNPCKVNRKENECRH